MPAAGANRRFTTIALTLTALLVAAGIGGIVLIAKTPRTNPSRVGITLDDSGQPMLTARACRATEIRYAQIEQRADGAGPVVWAARQTDGPGRADLPMADQVAGFQVTGSVNEAGDAWLEVGTVRDARDVSLGDSRDPAVFGDATAPGPYGFSSTSIQLSNWNGQFLIRGSVPTRSDPQFCFQDLSTCQQVTDFVATSPDGISWNRIAAEDRGTNQESTTFVTLVVNSAPVAIVAQHSVPPAPAVNDAGPSRSPVVQDLQLWRWSTNGRPSGMAPAIPTTTAPPLPMLDTKNPDLAMGASARVQWYTGGCGGGGFTVGGKTFLVAQPGLPKPGPNWPAKTLGIIDGPSLMVLGTLTHTSEDELVFKVEGTDVTVRLVPGQATGGCM